jgi:hypothetical protein
MHREDVFDRGRLLELFGEVGDPRDKLFLFTQRRRVEVGVPVRLQKGI